MGQIQISKSLYGIHSDRAFRTFNTTFEDFLKLICIEAPRTYQKDGSYFLRCGKNSDDASLLVIDGNDRFSNDGSILSGAPNPELIHSILSGLNLSYVIYTTFSNAMTKDELEENEIDSGGLYGENYHRYRIVIECEYNNESCLNFFISYLMNKFYKHGAMLLDSYMNRIWMRPWYFPRIPKDQNISFKYYYNVGDRLDIHKALSDLETTFTDGRKSFQIQEANNSKEHVIASWLESIDNTNAKTKFTVSDVLSSALGLNPPYSKQDEMSVAKILKSLGFSKKRQLVQGEQKMLWFKKTKGLTTCLHHQKQIYSHQVTASGGKDC
jgi:hypothetical protein